jgi:predicted small secreted protein
MTLRKWIIAVGLGIIAGVALSHGLVWFVENGTWFAPL